VLDRVPIRWRLAGTSALLTLIILCAFALAIGTLTASRIRSDFNHETQVRANQLTHEVLSQIHVDSSGLPTMPKGAVKSLSELEGGIIRVSFATDPDLVIGESPAGGPNLGEELKGTSIVGPYLVVPVLTNAPPQHGKVGTRLLIQYGRRTSDVEATISRVRLFLILGVLGGTALALFAGLWLARRAMRPIDELTGIAHDIAQTRNPEQRMPPTTAEDEVAELSRTLDEMLDALAASRAETEAMLKRQQQFVADASHELRTPLTSVMANLELLADTLSDDQGEAARSALRSSRRMRRLVVDLLLLARADARRPIRPLPVDMGQVVVEASGELGAITDAHELTVETHPAWVTGSRDDLLRMVVNLVENAISHTPPGTHVQVRVQGAGGRVVLSVTDDGPGISPDMREQIFERFVRGAGDRGGSFGLGLSIVRVVAEQHGGSVTLAPTGGRGARFVVTLPAMADAPTDGAPSSREPQIAGPAGPLS
jgi:two-component system, OmpR family, sensor kinase